MWRIPGLIAVALALAGCTTSVVELRPAAPGAELWGHRTLVVANLGTVDRYRRDAEEAFAYQLPGAISADALEAGEAAFDEEAEEDQVTWDTIVRVSLVDGEEKAYPTSEVDELVDFEPDYLYSYLDFRVSVVRRADGRELLSMVIRSRAGVAGVDSFERLLDDASARAGEELKKSGLFR